VPLSPSLGLRGSGEREFLLDMAALQLKRRRQGQLAQTNLRRVGGSEADQNKQRGLIASQLR